ncbi:unnamed protein product [Hydatigera taeniaeformis]|uniref:Calmodulin n=1 Tax=Hydatigena taeniaeformis TaxID=6205 RepID=A0A0R3X894_HYDTA|nr:unnamed protein product [Hydatigera taeniaeformis]
MSNVGQVEDSVNSETFWYCITQSAWPDVIDIITLILEISGLLLNILAAILLLRVTEGNKVSIVLLRTIFFNNIVDAIIKLLGDVTPARVEFSIVELNYAICVLWDSRFLYWLFNKFSIEAFIFFAIDRALTLDGSQYVRFVPMESRLTLYQASIYIYGLLITIPQFFSVNLERGGCACAPTTVNVPFLAIIYAHVFIRFALLVVLNGAVVLYSAFRVIRWVEKTPVREQVDELNFLHFSNPSEAELKRLEPWHSWKTPSMSILPIGICFIITFGFDATYQFLSGAGLTTYVIGGAPQKMGTLMLLIFTNFVPLTLMVALPPHIPSPQLRVDGEFGTAKYRFDLNIFKVAKLELLKPATANLSPAQMQEISEAFSLFDNDKDNRLSPYEFKVALVALGFELKPDEINELLQSADVVEDNKICFRDFFTIVKKLIQERDPITEIVQAFKLFDEEASGKISYRTLKKIAKELGENLSDDELHVMIDEFDRDGDRSISLEEFMNILSD